MGISDVIRRNMCSHPLMYTMGEGVGHAGGEKDSLFGIERITSIGEHVILTRWDGCFSCILRDRYPW